MVIGSSVNRSLARVLPFRPASQLHRAWPCPERRDELGMLRDIDLLAAADLALCIASLDRLTQCAVLSGQLAASADPVGGNLQLAPDAFPSIDKFNLAAELEWNKLANYARAVAGSPGN